MSVILRELMSMAVAGCLQLTLVLRTGRRWPVPAATSDRLQRFAVLRDLMPAACGRLTPVPPAGGRVAVPVVAPVGCSDLPCGVTR